MRRRCISPGDQDYPVYHHPQVRRVLANAVQWAAPTREIAEPPQITNPR
jgi:trehalose utilization protein